MFNYYCRIAALAKEYEIDGKIGKSIELKEILKSENRCKNCGTALSQNDEVVQIGKYICDECSIFLEI